MNSNTTPTKPGNSKPAKLIKTMETPDIDATLRRETQSAVEATQKSFTKGSAGKPSPYGS